MNSLAEASAAVAGVAARFASSAGADAHLIPADAATEPAAAAGARRSHRPEMQRRHRQTDADAHRENGSPSESYEIEQVDGATAARWSNSFPHAFEPVVEKQMVDAWLQDNPLIGVQQTIQGVAAGEVGFCDRDSSVNRSTVYVSTAAYSDVAASVAGTLYAAGGSSRRMRTSCSRTDVDGDGAAC